MPHLADLALKVLYIPASSTSSERISSAAGLTATSRRGRLQAERFANTDGSVQPPGSDRVPFKIDSFCVVLHYRTSTGGSPPQ
jgi:hypothetical protein